MEKKAVKDDFKILSVLFEVMKASLNNALDDKGGSR